MKRISTRWIQGLGVLAATSMVAFSVSAKELARPKVVYGKDDRLDVYQVSDSNLLSIASSTAAMIPNASLSSQNQVVSIKTKVFGEDFGLCKDEPFYNQPNPAMCSGFLVGPDLIATAGHCINEFSCSANSFVFDFKMDGPNQLPNSTQVDNVYSCKRILGSELTREQDWALVQLDRPVVNRQILKMASRPAGVGDSLVMIGHPSGLPTKVAAGANVRRDEKGFFVANTDSYGGNSGSAVFDAKTLEVVGILVRGEQDFTFDQAGQCTRSYYCKDDECRGEDVTHIDYINQALRSN